MTIKRIKVAYNLTQGLFWLSVALPLPLMVLLIQQRGIDLFKIGVSMGVYSLTIVLLELPTGGLADAIGRKRVAIIAHTIMLLSTVVLFFAFSFISFLTAMLLNGVGRALASGALDAWFVDQLQAADPKIELQPALAQASTVALLALGLGTLTGGFLPQLLSQLPDSNMAFLSPISTTLIASIGVQIVLLAVIHWLIYEPNVDTAVAASLQKNLRQLPTIINEAITMSRQNSILLMLMGATLVTGLTLASLETFWQPHFATLLSNNDNTIWFGVIMAGNFLVGMIGNQLSIPLSKKMNRRYGLVAACVRGLQGLCLLLLAAQSSVIPAALLFWFVYLNMGIGHSPHNTLVNEQVPAERRSTMLSVQSLASFSGGFLGNIILGRIAEAVSIPTAWIVSGGLLVVSLWLYIQIDRKIKPRETHDQAITTH